jgi:hypothetical protein
VDNERELYAYERSADGNRCIVALNRSEVAQTVVLPSAIKATDLFTDHPWKGAQLVVPARQAVILRVES